MRLTLFVALPLALCLLSACERAKQTDLEVDKKQEDQAPNALADDKKEDDKGGPRNWSSWRGPENNGVSREKDLPESWSLAKKENLVFATNEGSIATPIVHDGCVYLLGKCGEGITQQERVLCFDADKGDLKWEKKYNVWHSGIVEARIGFTNMAADPETGYVYAHLTSGQLLCFDKDGKVIWERSMTEEFGRVTGYGGRVTTPIVDEDKVILSMIAGSWGAETVGNTRLIAFDKKKGDVIWMAGGNKRVKDTYYSTPVVGVIKGERIVITGGGDGHVHAFQVRTGKKVWSLQIEDGEGAINCAPVIQGDKVWIGHGEENGNNSQGRLVCIDAGEVKDEKPKLVWKYDGVKVKFASPILHEGLLYVCDEVGKLFCFDAEKGGEPLWEFSYGANTCGSPVWADGKIYVSEQDGKFHILAPSKDGCKRLHQLRFRGKGGFPIEMDGSPAIVNGRIYFTTSEQLVCIGKKDHKAKPDKMPAAAKEEAPAKDAAVAHVQVVPADVPLDPGKSAELKAFGYDDKGRRLGEVKVEWSKAGVRPPVYPPTIKAPPPNPNAKAPPAIAGLSAESGIATKFTAATKPNGMFGTIVAKAGKLSGEARVRIMPALPYEMDFKDVPEGRTPGAWVNAPGKFSVVTFKGEKVLFKRNDTANPIVARANAYITSPHASDYTIEADVYGEMANKDSPDMGVGACRYTLMFAGNDGELRLNSWDAQKRLEKKIKYAWKAGVWYRMKLMATTENGKGIIKGKVWERDKKEPDEWTIEAEDPVPNTEGFPTLYGYPAVPINAKNPGSVIYYANVKITPNKKK